MGERKPIGEWVQDGTITKAWFRRFVDGHRPTEGPAAVASTEGGWSVPWADDVRGYATDLTTAQAAADAVLYALGYDVPAPVREVWVVTGGVQCEASMRGADGVFVSRDDAMRAAMPDGLGWVPDPRDPDLWWCCGDRWVRIERHVVQGGAA